MLRIRIGRGRKRSGFRCRARYAVFAEILGVAERDHRCPRKLAHAYCVWTLMELHDGQLALGGKMGNPASQAAHDQVNKESPSTRRAQGEPRRSQIGSAGRLPSAPPVSLADQPRALQLQRYEFPLASREVNTVDSVSSGNSLAEKLISATGATRVA